MIAAFFGVLMMFYGSLKIGELWGNMLALITAISFSIYTIIIRSNKNIDMLPCLLISGIMAMGLTSFQNVGSLQISTHDFFLCFLLGGVLSGFVNCCFVFATRHLIAAEATLFFLLDNAHLGGGSSAGVDIVISGTNYEVKAGNLPGDGGGKEIIGFKLGGTVPIAKEVKAALEIRDVDPKIARLGRERTGVNGSQIKAIMKDRKLAARWKKEVEIPYAKEAAKYLGKNKIIFMINTTPASRIGEVAAIMKPKLADISIDVVTQGTIKPRVKIG